MQPRPLPVCCLWLRHGSGPSLWEQSTHGTVDLLRVVGVIGVVIAATARFPRTWRRRSWCSPNDPWTGTGRATSSVLLGPNQRPGDHSAVCGFWTGRFAGPTLRRCAVVPADQPKPSVGAGLPGRTACRHLSPSVAISATGTGRPGLKRWEPHPGGAGTFVAGHRRKCRQRDGRPVVRWIRHGRRRCRGRGRPPRRG